jgi:hypothetical protein
MTVRADETLLRQVVFNEVMAVPSRAHQQIPSLKAKANDIHILLSEHCENWACFDSEIGDIK